MKFYTNVAQVNGKLLVRGYDDQGRQVMKTIRYQPSFYIENNGEGDYQTLEGRRVMQVTKKSIYDANDYLKRNRDVSNKTVYGYEQFAYTYINEEFNGPIEYDPNLIRVANIDIETASDEGMPDIETANKPITAITVKLGNDILSLGCDDYTPTEPDVTYIRCETEEELIEKFLQAWEWYQPDVVTGWYIENFDIPYIVNRIKRLLGEKAATRLSPWGHLREKVILDKNKEKRLYFPTGVALLDYIKIYKKMELEPRESYSLNYIASVEVGAKKLDYSEYENLFALYKENFPKFMAYNILDVRLVDKIEQKKRMLNLTYQMAYAAHCNFEDINSPVRMWEAICYNDLMDRKIVFPPRQNVEHTYGEDEEIIDLEGGYVKEPIPGMYKWVVSIDLVSSYPHQIMQYNISPETYRGKRPTPYGIEEYLTEKEDVELPDLLENFLISAGNGCLFDKSTEGFLPRLLSQWFNQRDAFKKVMKDTKQLLEICIDPKQRKILENKIADYDNKQKVYKVALNSAYGALSNKYFRFYSFDLADSVTSSGRLAVRWAEKKLNEYMNKIMFTTDIDYVIAMDTDSVYLNMGPLIEKKYGPGNHEEKTAITDLLDMTVRNKIEPYLVDCYIELQKKVNAEKQKMQMNRESIADVGIWTGKKRYVLNIIDKEGLRYTTPKIEIKGMDSVRSSTPASCREAIKNLIKVIIYQNEDAAQIFIDDFKTRFQILPFDEIAFPRGINGMEQYADEALLCKKGTPAQVRGALVYNQMLKERNITNFSPIYDGDKAKFCYLITPNPARSYVITVPAALPKALGLDDKLDRDKQFEVAFLNPVTKIMDAIGWRIEPEGNTLEALMGKT